MPFLGIETATARGSIALAGGGHLLAEQGLQERAWHARDLLPRIDRMLHDAGLEPRGLRGIGVAVGPGSFTGIRVGMATGKGMAYALGVGLAGISTLEALARAASPGCGRSGTILCAAIEAGRGEVYAALFTTGEAGPVRSAPDRSVRPAELVPSLPGGTVLAGDGAGTILRAASEAGRSFPVVEPCPPLAGSIALWAADTVRPGEGYRAGALGPNYIRPSDAEARRTRP